MLSQQSKDLISSKNVEYQVSMFTRKGRLIQVYPSVYEASKALQIPTANIRTHLNSGTKTCSDFIFKKGLYVCNIEPAEPHKKPINRKKRDYTKLKRPVYQYSMNNEFIREWRSMTVAAEALGLNKRCISAVCCGITKQTGGFKWSKTLK